MEQENIIKIVKKLQASERMEEMVYLKIAKFIKNNKDKETLTRIAHEEGKHYEIWKGFTKCDVKENRFQVFWYVLLARLLGYTFTIKIMENRLDKENEALTSKILADLETHVPRIKEILEEEEKHEEMLIDIIDEEKLQYVGSMVLGLNDALVEFSGSLAGWSFAMQNNRLITLAGLITGIAATLSMASSEYLSTKNEDGENALKSAVYTGIAYLFTVVILLLPYILLPKDQYFLSLIIMLVAVIIIIAGFNFYISVAKSLSFKTKFLEMSTVSLSVAAVSFLIGLLVKQFLGINI